MEAQLAEFRNKGMMQDASISKSSNEFAFKNVNIRITAVNDNTLFSVTNEKGSEGVDIKKTEVAIPNKITFVEGAHIGQDISWKAVSQYPVASDIEIEFEHHGTLETYYFYINEGESESNVIEAWDTDYPSYQNTQIDITEDDSYTYYVDGDSVPEERKVIVDQTIEGAYIGKCIIGNYLILFTKETGHDRIYRCGILDNGNLLADCIVDRDLGFAGPVETVGYFEREDIQKVYWVDGTNPNRVINIMLDADKQPNSFDFNPEVGDIPTISVSKQYNGVGSFPGGTIQYFVSYYNELGQETKIANATSLYYITDSDKGVKPGDTATCSFNITLSGLNTNFEYIRVYSAIRSTLDGPIDARIVGNYAIPSNRSITITDTGRNETAIDSSLLYYIGGDRFIASTIEDKDNVLFFGDIEFDNIILSNEEITAIQQDFNNTIDFVLYKSDDGDTDLTEQYRYSNDGIFGESRIRKGFKYGNIYRFGIQLINANGQFTDAIYLCDKKCEISPVCYSGSRNPSPNTARSKYIPKILFSFPQQLQNSQDVIDRFSCYRIVVAETCSSNRIVVAQGIINPTIFKLKDRVSDSGPYAIPSWITRPENTPNSRHLEIIGGHTFVDSTRQIEAFVPDKNHEISHINDVKPPIYEDINGNSVNPSELSYYVDKSILTLNSPDITESTNISGLKFRIVGVALHTYMYDDFQISISNPNERSKVNGLTETKRKMDFHTSNYSERISGGGWSNVEYYDWSEYMFGAETPYLCINDSYNYMLPIISIWNKSGSLWGASSWNNERNVLEGKLYSSYKYCCASAYFSSYNNYQESDISIFDGEQTLVKSGEKYISGNYDELIASISQYNYYGVNPSENKGRVAPPGGITSYSCSDPIRIRVKYQKCAIINLGDKILPYIQKQDSQYQYEPNYVLPWSISSLYGNQYNYTCYKYWNISEQVGTSQDVIYSNIHYYDNQSGEYAVKRLFQSGLYYPDGTGMYSGIGPNSCYLFIGELYKDVPGATITDKANILYGPNENIKWIPCGTIQDIGNDTSASETEGDTFFQRWDCLRAYPYAEGDENSVVDIVSFMVETYQNLDARYDNNRGYENMNYARPTNYGLLNPVYNQANNIFKYNTIEERLQYQNFPQQFAWSLNKSAVSEIDTWTSATLSNIYNTDGSYGPINAIEKLNDTLIGFQDRAIFVINFNNRTQISTEQGLPIELANSGKVDGITYLTRHYGCKNKYSIVSTKTGLYFIDDENRAFVNISKDGIADITASSGMSIWFEKQTSYNKKWNGGDLAAQSNYSAFVVGYDSNRGDIYIMNGANSDAGCLVYNETLKTFTSFFDVSTTGYKFPLMYNFNGETYGLDGGDNSFNKLFGGTYGSNYSVEYRVNPEPLTDKIFTNIDYIADVYDTQKGVDDAMSLTNISASQPFDEISVFNEYQQKINVPLTENKWLQPTNATMFRIRHAEIPSTGTYGIDRMHNPWIHLKLNGNTKRALMQFHSLTVKYFK